MKKNKKKSSLKFPCGFDKNGNKFYPWIWDTNERRRVPNKNIISGDNCGLYFHRIHLSYVKSTTKTPYFREKGATYQRAGVGNSSNNLSLKHKTIQTWIVNEKIIPLPLDNTNILNPAACTEHYLDDCHPYKIFHKNGKQKFKTIEEFINNQSNFFKYYPKVIHLYGMGLNFQIAEVKKEVYGHELIHFKEIYEKLDEVNMQNFKKLKFDIVGFDSNKVPVVILEIFVTHKVNLKKRELLQLIALPSVELTVTENELNFEDSSWYKNFDIYKLQSKWIHNSTYNSKFSEFIPLIYAKLIDNKKIFEIDKTKISLTQDQTIDNKVDLGGDNIQKESTPYNTSTNELVNFPVIEDIHHTLKKGILKRYFEIIKRIISLEI